MAANRVLRRLVGLGVPLLPTGACAAVFVVSLIALSVNFGGLQPASVNVSISVNASAAPIPAPSWGVNVAAAHVFNTSDAQLVAETPARVLRFPGGDFTEWLNWTSGLLTEPDGAVTRATTSLTEFVTACESIRCEAILELPAEIDEPATAAYYVAYTEKTLGFLPAYWEIGNEPSTWTHFDQPWSDWGSPGPKVSPSQYAVVVQQYIAAIRQIDPTTPILGLAGAEESDLAAWIPPLLSLDGDQLAGISVHAYPAVPTPVLVSPVQYFSSLTDGQYSLPTVVPEYQSLLASSCPNCSVGLFLTETGTSDGGTGAYAGYDSGFEGALYVAAEITQLLPQRIENVDWFTFQGGYAGSWVTSTAAPTPTFILMSRFVPELGSDYVPTTVTGFPNVYAAGTTTGSQAYALLVVNTNVASQVTFNLSRAGFSGPTVTALYWPDGSPAPTETSFRGTAVLARLSVALLYQSGPPVPAKPVAETQLSLVGFGNPGALVALAGVDIGVGAVIFLLTPSYWKSLGGAAGIVGLLLFLLVV